MPLSAQFGNDQLPRFLIGVEPECLVQQEIDRYAEPEGQDQGQDAVADERRDEQALCQDHQGQQEIGIDDPELAEQAVAEDLLGVYRVEGQGDGSWEAGNSGFCGVSKFDGKCDGSDN